MGSPSINLNKEIKMSGMQALVGKRVSKSVKFMNTDLTINKLTVDEVMEIQVKAKNIEGNEEEGFNVLKHVIKSSADGAKDLSDDDFKTFPMDELSKLSNEIMKFSGLGAETGK